MSRVKPDPLVYCVGFIETKSYGKAPQPSNVTFATGLFYKSNNKKYIVTNKHVVEHSPRDLFPDTLEIKIQC